ncbi:MAG: alcohol dehydrogenase catalytic domain-containing protein [Candidatus Methanomethylicaceae archaeon]
MSKEKMHAVVIYGKEDFRYEEVPKPIPKEDEVLVKIHKCGICAADPKIFHGKGYFSPVVYSHAPIIAGHEFVGEVVELGPNARKKYGLEVGDKAIMEHIVPCGECYYCKRGLYNLCAVHIIPGVKMNGGWAEYMLYPKNSIIHKIPKEIPWKAAVLIEPLACACHAVERIGIKLEDSVLVIGDGPIGQLMLQVARLKNPRLLMIAGHNDERLKVSRDIGADIVINSKKENVVERVLKETDGIGADVVLEAAGTPSAVEEAVNLLRKRGRLLIFGVYGEKAAIDWSIISDIKELEIYGGHLAPYVYPVAIRLLQKKLINADKIVTHDFPLKEWRNAIETAEKRKEGAIKVAMSPP